VLLSLDILSANYRLDIWVLNFSLFCFHSKSDCT